jgi:hypothetical protein
MFAGQHVYFSQESEGSISVKPAPARGVNRFRAAEVHLEEHSICGRFEHARSCAVYAIAQARLQRGCRALCMPVCISARLEHK